MNPGRPGRLVVVLGTATEIGKTWVARKLLEQARDRGLRVAARKPAQSFTRGEGQTDAELLALASGESEHDVCPAHRWYPVPMAPPMAADVLGRGELRLDELLAELSWPENVDLGLIETAGGVRSPLTHDADNVDLVRRVRADEVLLIADAGLGTLSSVRLALDALAGERVTVLLNRFDPGHELHRRNLEWLHTRDAVNAITDPMQWWELRGTALDRPSHG